MRALSFRFPSVRRRILRVSALLLPALSVLAAGANALERPAPALVREDTRLERREVILRDLVSEQGFDGKYFRILLGDTDTVIPWDASETLRLKAATAYHALTLAREKYVAFFGPLPHLQRKITIRLDQARGYSEVIHFTPDAVYNGALSIGASDDMRDEASAPEWGPEIWFFQPRKVRQEGVFSQIGDILSQNELRQSVLLRLLEGDVESGVKDVIQNRFFLEPHLYSVALSIGIAEILPGLIAKVSSLFKQTLYLDAALIPEIVVHEYGHHALSPWLSLKSRSHLTEGFPNYFAGKFLGLTRLQARGKDYSKGYAPRLGDSSLKYSLDEELGAGAATSSFTYSLLNDLERALGDEGEAVLARSLPYIGRSSSLKPDFQNAILRAISEISANRRSQLIRAQAVFSQRGM